MESIEVGWFLPSSGDTSAHGDPDADVTIDPAYLGRVVQAAEHAGFEYLLIPVDQRCWEAYIAGAFWLLKRDRLNRSSPLDPDM